MDYYKIEACRSSQGCPRAVGDTGALQIKLEEILKAANFDEERKSQLGHAPKHHHIFKVCLAGCANCCSQPQIKDFALVAKALPSIDPNNCSLCNRCVKACKEKCLSIIEGQLQLNKDKCLGCGDCWRVCPTGAINTTEATWRLLIGGKLGRHPQLAQEIKEVSPNEGVDSLKQCIKIILNSSSQDRIADILLKNKSSL
jgi:dissimilatory sulfite reductase (desulfoviridin) alpha/beta subunit